MHRGNRVAWNFLRPTFVRLPIGGSSAWRGSIVAEDKSRFEGKVALVTGGSAGIGAAIAQALVNQGARVVIAARRETEGKATAAKIGGNASFFRADMGNPEDCKALIAHVTGSCGRLDLAVNNAGLGSAGKLVADEDERVFNQIVAVNLTGVFSCMKYQIPAMLAAGGGAIVNVSSVSGLVGGAGMAAYSASKHGLIGLTKAAALEYVKQGIRVNAVCPVATRTDMVERWFTLPGVRDRVLSTIPAGRIAEPEEVAAATTFLLSNDASFITGQALAIDGGYVAQ